MRVGCRSPRLLRSFPAAAAAVGHRHPDLPPMLRCLEWVRFHIMCYDGVPKNARGEPQRSPYCVGLDGKRLNRLDCARETGLSTSVVNRQFATLERLGYIRIKKDGSIWYRGKVEPRAEASVRQSVTECLQGTAEAVCRTGTARLAAAGRGAGDSGLLAESYTIVSG